MNKTKLIIHERFNGKQTLEAVFLSVFQSESYQLLQASSSVIMRSTKQYQNPFYSRKAQKNLSWNYAELILENFCKEHDFRIFDVYLDDGFSSLNFERPEIQRMIKDIEDGKIK